MFGFGLSGYVGKARRFIAECMREADITDRKPDEFLPDERIISEIASHCRQAGLSAADCGLSLIDAGYDYQQKLAQRVDKMLTGGPPEGLPAEMATFHQAYLEGRTKLHDRLLLKAFEIGTTRYGTQVVPRFGKLGAAMTEHVGKFLKDA
jgi:hypothetical protein